MPLTFHANVPHWMRRMAGRWARVLGYTDWKIEISCAPDDEMGSEDEQTVMGLANAFSHYLATDIVLNEEMRDGADADDYICHELLHGHYHPFTLFFEQIWDGRKKVNKNVGRAMLTDLIEASIQRHVRQLQRARGKS